MEVGRTTTTSSRPPRSANIRIFALIGYQWPPNWFPDEWYTKHPPAIDSEGIYHTNRWQSDIINYEHPLARAQYAEWFQNVCSRYKNSKAIVGWIIGNESGYLGLWSGLLDGYDPESEAAFRDVVPGEVHERSRTRMRVGARAYASFTNMSFVEQYRAYGVEGAIWADMVQWREDSIGTFTAIGAKAAKAADTNHMIAYSTVGMQWGEEDWRYHAEDRGKITDACVATNAPVDFFAVNNYPWSILGHESQNGQWGISYTKKVTQPGDADGVPVLYSETGFTSSETMWPGMDEWRQGPLVRNALWEILEAGAIGTHIFAWHDRPYITDREKGFGILTPERRIKPAFWDSANAFQLMEQAKIGEPADGLARTRSRTSRFLWTAANDSQYNRYECEMQQMAGALERLGYEPNFINLNDLASGSLHELQGPRAPAQHARGPAWCRTRRTRPVLRVPARERAGEGHPHPGDARTSPACRTRTAGRRADFTNEMAQLFGIDAVGRRRLRSAGRARRPSSART